MIRIKLQGGLGNQLFQYAAASAVADYHKTKVMFDLSFFQKWDNNAGYTIREYELGAFKHIKIHPQNIFEKMIEKAIPVKFYEEKTLLYNPLIFKETSQNCYLTGYFQSEKYFETIKSRVRKELQLKLPDVDETFEKIREGNSVSLHVRRGDYASNPKISNFHGLCSLDYYLEAIKYIAKRISNLQIILFSDDLIWARQHLVLDYPMHFVENKSSLADMQLMSLCKHNITANSSYSWWGAWLNNNPDKIVITPKRWFADEKAESESKTIVPERWIRL